MADVKNVELEMFVNFLRSFNEEIPTPVHQVFIYQHKMRLTWKCIFTKYKSEKYGIATVNIKIA